MFSVFNTDIGGLWQDRGGGVGGLGSGPRWCVGVEPGWPHTLQCGVKGRRKHQRRRSWETRGILGGINADMIKPKENA